MDQRTFASNLAGKYKREAVDVGGGFVVKDCIFKLSMERPDGVPVMSTSWGFGELGKEFVGQLFRLAISRFGRGKHKGGAK